MQQLKGKITKQTLADRVAERILSLISSGVLKPGDTLPAQRELAADMGVSLPAVREAIQRLQMLRVVRTEQGSGMVVGEVSWQQVFLEPSLLLVSLEGDALRHMWEARHAIENQVARLAAARATQEDIATLRKILDRAGAFLPTFEENRDLNREFHIALARAAKNPVLEEMLSGLLGIDLSAVRKIYSESISRHSWEIHRRIFDAVVKRDQRAAVLAMDEHAAALDAEMGEVASLVLGRDVPRTPPPKRSRRLQGA